MTSRLSRGRIWCAQVRDAQPSGPSNTGSDSASPGYSAAMCWFPAYSPDKPVALGGHAVLTGIFNGSAIGELLVCPYCLGQWIGRPCSPPTSGIRSWRARSPRRSRSSPGLTFSRRPGWRSTSGREPAGQGASQPGSAWQTPPRAAARLGRAGRMSRAARRRATFGPGARWPPGMAPTRPCTRS
jgi:hypothetical protein